MAYSVRGRVLAAAVVLLLGSAAAGACSSGSGAALGAGGEGGGSAATMDCVRNSDCPGALLCHRTEHVCVECLKDSDCGDAESCTAAGACKKSTTSSSSSGDGGAPSSSGGTVNSGDAGAGNGTQGGTPSQGDAGMPGSPEGGSGSIGVDCNNVPLDPCAGIPHFVGTQVVDGNPADFCDIPPFTLALATSPYYRAPKAPVTSTTRATFRVAWSAAALHVFVDVEDAAVHPNLSGSLLNVWNGDNVEFYASPLTPAGLFNASRSYESGAFQVIAVPPNPAGIATAPSGLAAFTSTGQASPLQAALYKTALTANGYSLEAQIPWTTAAPVAGASIGFDAGLSDDIDGLTNVSTGQYRDYYALLYNAKYIGYCGTDYEPYCDSRNWCVPKALP